MLQRGGEFARDVAWRPRVVWGGDQLGGDAGESAVENELGAAAEIKHELLDPDLGAFRGIDGMQLTLVERDAAGRQPFAAQPALTQYEVEPRALGLTLGEIDPRPQRAGNRRRDVLQLGQLGDQRRDVRGVDPVDREVEV